MTYFESFVQTYLDTAHSLENKLTYFGPLLAHGLLINFLTLANELEIVPLLCKFIILLADLCIVPYYRIPRSMRKEANDIYLVSIVSGDLFLIS